MSDADDVVIVAGARTPIVRFGPSVSVNSREVQREAHCMSHSAPSGLAELIARLDEAVQCGNAIAVTQQIKRDLEDVLQAGRLTLDDRFRHTRQDNYTRRLLYRAPSVAYTVLVMTWAPGQRTALHDHAGIWCVEGVAEGLMEVTQYDLAMENAGLYEFVEKRRTRAAAGSAGCLIPPFEYHTLANALPDRPSITLHVYGGEMDCCHIFEPRADSWYTRRTRQLSYDE